MIEKIDYSKPYKHTIKKNHEQFLKLGMTSEKSVLEILNEKFGNITKEKYFYSIFDFCEKNADGKIIRFFELKSRNCKIDTFKDLCFGKNKFDKAKQLIANNIKVVFIWNLKSKNDPEQRELYFWEYTKDTPTWEYKFGFIKNTYVAQRKKEAIFVFTKYLKKLEFLEPVSP